MNVAIIAGASGLVGGKLLSLLLANQNCSQIISIGRRKLNINSPKLDQYIVDFEKLDELNIKADVVFCCLGTTIKKAGSQEKFRKVDFLYPKLLAQFSLKIGAEGFHIITAMGANAKAGIFYNKVKGEIEEELIKMSFIHLGIYRPSLLLGAREENRIVEGINQKLFKALGFLFIGPLKNYKAIPGDKVAEFILEKSLQQDKGASVYLSGEMQ